MPITVASSQQDYLQRFRVDGRIAVVTGGAHGIGLCAAQALHEAGANVVLLDRDLSAAQAAAQALAGAHAMAFDAADPASIEQAFAAVRELHGRVDILVNNAGMSIRKSSAELSLDEWNRVIAVNLTGSFLCARAAAALMPAQGGAIVSTASIMGLSGAGPYPNPSYHATKGALVNLTRSLAVEWAQRGIRVNAVAPTWTRTGFIGELADATLAHIRSVTPLGRVAEAQEVAAAILFLASPAAAMVTGHVLAVDGGFLAQ